MSEASIISSLAKDKELRDAVILYAANTIENASETEGYSIDYNKELQFKFKSWNNVVADAWDNALKWLGNHTIVAWGWHEEFTDSDRSSSYKVTIDGEEHEHFQYKCKWK